MDVLHQSIHVEGTGASVRGSRQLIRPPAECALLSVELGLDELDRVSQPCALCGLLMLYAIRQSSKRTWASTRESKRWPPTSSSRGRPLNDSIQAFCHGDPGSMKPCRSC
jgi:hypothetical protein